MFLKKVSSEVHDINRAVSLGEKRNRKALQFEVKSEIN